MLYSQKHCLFFCFAIRNLFSNPPLNMSLRKGYFPPQSVVSIRLPNEFQLLRSVHVFYCQCLQFLEIFFEDNIQTLIETKLLQTIADAAVSRQWYCCWSYKCIIVFLIKFLPQNVATTRWDRNQSIYISIAETTSYRTTKKCFWRKHFKPWWGLWMFEEMPVVPSICIIRLGVWKWRRRRRRGC